MNENIFVVMAKTNDDDDDDDDGVKSIGETFDRLKLEDKIAFIPFVVAGDPNLEATEKALKILGNIVFFLSFAFW